MSHIVYFGTTNLYTAYDLILSSKVVSEAKGRYYETTVPGMDGVLDTTGAFGRVRYDNRNITLNFSIKDLNNWYSLYNTFKNKYNGTYQNIILSEYDGFYFYGRVKINEFQTDFCIGKLVVDVYCYPYMFKNTITEVTAEVTDTATITLSNLSMEVFPVVDLSADMTITIGTTSISMAQGANRTSEYLLLQQGDTEITVTGTGTITFRYREGQL